MLLAIDVGNTNTVFAVFDGETMRGQWRAGTDVQRTADEHAVWFGQPLEPRRNIHPFSMDVFAVIDDIAKVNSNVEIERAGCKSVQQFDGASDGVLHRWKLDEKSIAGEFYDVPD